MTPTTKPHRTRARLTDRVGLALPVGWRERIDADAEDADMVPAEWMRHALRNALEAARKQRTRSGP